ncbi:hypothetical protein acsn021_04350 [Anaerocolumna cellulosilytica]|uniref:Uncharacterized protein n=1 Tax=Anaerocolumna cellulosilytica TaxID=433286 RepID=A0A6S6QT84_9FIRM|nr:hypothetical protein [Anaerocolumna cellulosilytica]MBB5195798.1 hypothetical protein [Anaerocolumna cellulosilytica]BCJ92866.1 hypothetical protein acsn021_04350 [Anaerocolumna cellulosilytica]
MNIRYKETMEQVKMRDKCSNEIKENLLNLCDKTNVRGTAMKRQLVKRRIAAAIVAIVCLISATGIVYASDGIILEYVYSFFNGGGITLDEKDGVSFSTVVLDSEPISPVELIDGKMYFIADGSGEDITDKISDSIPFIGEYTGKDGNTHKFIIGGKPIENYYGYREVIIDSNGIYIGGMGWYGNKLSDIEKLEWAVKGESLLGLE